MDLKKCSTVLHTNLFHLLLKLLPGPYRHHIKQYQYIVDDQHKFPNKWMVLPFLFSENKMYTFLLCVFSNRNKLFYKGIQSYKNANFYMYLGQPKQYHLLLFYTLHLKGRMRHKTVFDNVHKYAVNTS